MKIPPPPIPPVPKLPLFAGATEKHRNDQLGADIRSMFDDLLRVTYVPAWQEMLIKFKGAVNPGGTFDPQRLPYQAAGPNLAGDKGAGRLPSLACLYTRLSWIIQLYWRLVLTGDGNEGLIRQYMAEIEIMFELRDERGNKLKLQQILSRCFIEGDIRHGFWISIPEVPSGS